MEYFIRFAQYHETFRKPEIEALALLNNVKVEFVHYTENSPYAILRFPNEAAAQAIISRSISSKAIYELWGTGSTYENLHLDVRNRTQHLWHKYANEDVSFRFQFDTFQGSLSLAQQTSTVNSFRYLGFLGPIRLKRADQTFTVFEEFDGLLVPSSLGEGVERVGDLVSSLSLTTPLQEQQQEESLYQDSKIIPSSPPTPPPFTTTLAVPKPRRIYFGRYITSSQRSPILEKYTLKKRNYINTTSMDSELAFLTANITLARPNTIFYDPFVGTGSFLVACAHLGAYVLGSDIDGRMIRGTRARNLRSNFGQYGLDNWFLDGFVCDLTNSPLRCSGGGGGSSNDATTGGGRRDSVGRAGGKGGRYLDGIICDPPYGVREGLKVLGSRTNKDHNNTHHENGETKADRNDNDKNKKNEMKKQEPRIIDGVPAYLQEGYVPPKRAYSLEAMLDDILLFAARTLVDRGRCSLWMPTARQEAGPDAAASTEAESGEGARAESEGGGGGGGEMAIPTHPALELVSCCVQDFNKWSRRLLTYQRIPGVEVDDLEGVEKIGREYRKGKGKGKTANELNDFRRRYFQGFREAEEKGERKR